jgi:hypothetical protein
LTRRAVLVGAACIAVTSPALAAAAADCNSAISLAPGAPLGLAKIVGPAPRAFFIKSASDAKGCPSEAAACRSRSYVVPGNEVFVGASTGGFVCASFVSSKGLETAGWLPAAAVTGLPAPAHARSDDWLGTWQGNVEQKITIRPGKAKGKLAIAGDATFGATDPERVKRGGVNVGELAAEAAPRDGALAFTMVENGTKPYDQGDQYDCRVRMRRFAAYLLVEDNHMCGGNNVSFTGTYRRK